MKSIEDQIWDYGQLPPGERREIEEYVKTHSEYRELLEEVRWLYACFKEAGFLGTNSAADEALAYLVASEYVDKHPLPPLLSEAYGRLGDRVAEDADAMERFQVIKQRMEHVASFSSPSAEFERLTGHSLDADWEASETRQDAARYAADRGAQPPVRARSLSVPRWTTLYTLAGISVFFLLAWFSNANQRLAYTEPVRLGSDARLISIRTLDLPLDSLPVDVLALKGQMVLNDAQQHWLNLYYWYDQDLLDEAESMFMAVLGREDASIRLIAVSSYFLGKIHLSRGAMETARGYLEDTRRLQDVWSDEASELLKRIGRGV